jgi:AmmeMemoRadiSam system protein B
MSLADRAVYATQPAALRQQVEHLLEAAGRPDIQGDLIALIVPNTNRVEAGPAAAAAIKLVEGEDFDVVLAVAPSHEGAFGRLAVARADVYHTPLGEVEIDDQLRNELCDEDDDIFLDDRGHYHVEGVAAMLPFLQVALPGPFRVVPIVMGDESPAFCRELGAAIGEVMYGKRALLVASADVLGADDGAIDRFTEAFETFDTAELLHVLGSEALRVEGSGAVIVAALAAKHRGANQARVLNLEAPADAGGDGADRPGSIACVLWRG